MRVLEGSSRVRRLGAIDAPPLPTAAPLPPEHTEVPLPPNAPTPEPARPSRAGGPGPAASLAGDVACG